MKKKGIHQRRNILTESRQGYIKGERGDLKDEMYNRRDRERASERQTFRRVAASAASTLQRVHSPSRLHVAQAKCGITGGGVSTRATEAVHQEGGIRYRPLISCDSWQQNKYKKQRTM